ncbi:MAG: VWA domain-containing protein [Planctomycetota bacterium]
MPFTFDHPALLSLLLLIGPIVWLGWRGLRVLDRPRRITALVLRCVVLSLIVAMLAGLSTQRRHDDLTVLAVVDRSASVRTFVALPELTGNADTSTDQAIGPTDTDAALLRFLAAAAGDPSGSEARRPDDHFGLVTYDARPSLRARPGPRDELTTGTLDAVQTGTDTAAAVSFALASAGGGTNGQDTALRLVLVTDGNDTAGDLLDAARAAAAAGVSIDVLPLPYAASHPDAPEVMVEGVYAPPQAREGQTVPVRVVLRGTAPAAGSIELLRDGVLLDLDPDPQRTGLRVTPSDWSQPKRDADEDAPTAGTLDHVLAVTIDLPLTAAGPSSFTALFEPGASATAAARRLRVRPDLAINNRADGFTQVQGKGRLLMVNGLDPAPGRILPDTLRQRGLELDVIEPEDFPTTVQQLQRYDAVLFQNVPADDIRPTQQRQLVRYVEDLGGGFAMIGGPDSFGAGGWTNSAIDQDLLPVTCEIPSQTILPSGALVICLDRSGSMAIPVGGTGQTQLELAGEAAIAAVRTLYPQDLVGVVAFDSTPKWVVELGPNRDPNNTARLIRSIQPEGGTHISAGLDQVHESLADQRFADTAVRHGIVLTDGYGDSQNLAQIMARFRADDISVTTVGVGDEVDEQLLRQIASLGNGTYHRITEPTRLPQIFIKEARTIRKNLVREEPFTPQQVNTGSPITAGLSFDRSLAGLVLTGTRRDRRVEMPLLGPEGEPLFATGQVGLGRAAAFTSDATNRWAAGWLDWPGYADFWTRLTRSLARPAATPDADLLATFEGDEMVLTLETYEDPTNPEANLARAFNATGGVLKPDGSIQPVTLQQIGPGRFEARMPAPDDGNHVATLFLNDAAGNRIATVFGGASRPPGEELRRFTPDHAVLEQVAAITGGRVLDPADPGKHPLFARTEPFSTVSTRPLRWSLMPWLLLFLLLDIANRRIAWDAPAIATYLRDHVAPQRQSAQQRQTLQSLKQRKAQPAATNQPTQERIRTQSATTTQPTPTPPPPAVPTATTPKPSKPKPPPTPSASPTIESNPDEDDANSTTSRLLAAKRRANRDD